MYKLQIFVSLKLNIMFRPKHMIKKIIFDAPFFTTPNLSHRYIEVVLISRKKLSEMQILFIYLDCQNVD